MCPVTEICALLTPSVSGSNFWVTNMAFNMGTQSVIAAIRDDAGNTTFATNQVFLSIVTNASYSHNAAGCITSVVYSGQSYSKSIGLTWNSQYQLTAVSTNGTECERNGYDAFGRRVWNWNGTTTNYFIWSGADLIAEVDSTGGLRRAYVYASLDMPLAMTVYTGATAKTYFYLTDKMGTVHAVADETGNIVEQYRMDAWGRVLGVYDGDSQPLTESTIGNRLLAQGREYSWKTGFYYHRARWLDPTVGRWLSNDPIGISGGLNQYVFCANSPVNFRDSSGRCRDGNKFINDYVSKLMVNPYNAEYVIDQFLSDQVGMIDIGLGLNDDEKIIPLGGRLVSKGELGNIAAGQATFHAYGPLAGFTLFLAEAAGLKDTVMYEGYGAILPNAWGSFTRNAEGVVREVGQHPVRAGVGLTGPVVVYRGIRGISNVAGYIVLGAMRGRSE